MESVPMRGAPLGSMEVKQAEQFLHREIPTRILGNRFPGYPPARAMPLLCLRTRYPIFSSIG